VSSAAQARPGFDLRAGVEFPVDGLEQLVVILDDTALWAQT
jgi:hypothetical protein